MRSGSLKTRILAALYGGLLLSLYPLLGLSQNTAVLEKVHLKDNRFFIGVITEMVTDDHLVIITLGGDEYTIPMADVAQITCEKGTIPDVVKEKLGIMPPPRIVYERIPNPPWLRHKGYFFQIQYHTDYAQLGIRAVNGYKFGRLAHVGIGFGIQGVQTPVQFWPWFHRDLRDSISGLYLPLFVQYSGDILNKGTTPFYSLELGYAFNPIKDIGWKVRLKSPGGVHAAAVFGIRINTFRRYHTNIGFRVSILNTRMTFREIQPEPTEGLWRLRYSTRNATGLFLGITVVHGF